MLLNAVPSTKNYLAKMPTVLKSRNSVLEERRRDGCGEGKKQCLLWVELCVQGLPVGLAGCRLQPPSGLAADLITLTRQPFVHNCVSETRVNQKDLCRLKLEKRKQMMIWK